MGRHTREFQRRWDARYPDVELHLIRTNSATGGLAEGLCDIAVLRTAVDGNRFTSAIVGHERRYCALAADDPWARRPATAQPPLRETRDIDDWLAIIAAGGIGITPEGTTAQYRRDGIAFRPLRDAPPIPVQMIWRRHHPHPFTHAAIAMLTEIYHRPP